MGDGDYYQTLGLSKGATKEEIKEAFRSCALKFHPDRHAHSSDEVRNRALLRFREVSEAYEVLADDRRRADYDRAHHRHHHHRYGRPFTGYHSSAGYGYSGAGGGGGYRARAPGGLGFNVDLVFQYLTSRRFLLNVALAGVLLGGTIIIERSGETIWKMNNSGKSFEDAMRSIKDTKVQKDKG